MPRAVLPLTDIKCRQAKHDPAKGKSGTKLFDGGGLFLLVSASGSKLWRMKYLQPNGKENLLSFGEYPTVSIAEARDERAKAKALIKKGVDPAIQRDVDRVMRVDAATQVFNKVAEEWLDTKNEGWTAGTIAKTRQLLVRDLYPDLGRLPISEISPVFILEVVRKIEKRGAFEMPRRAFAILSQVFHYAMGKGWASADPSAGMVSQLKKRPPPTHYPHVESEQLPTLLARIEAYPGWPQTIAAVELCVLTFVRGGELIYAEWTEFDLTDEKVWRVPPGRMKGSLWHKVNGDPHVVPLSTQAIGILERLRRVTGHSRLLFPGMSRPDKPITAAAMNKVFAHAGFKGQQTVHGLRGLASTHLNESGLFEKDIIEAQLAHKDKDKVRAAYNHAKYLRERARIMQWWGDFIDQRRGRNVVPINGATPDLDDAAQETHQAPAARAL